MKKLLLSASFVCTCLGTVLAQSTATPYTGSYTVVVQDYITLTPSGPQSNIQTLTFTTPTAQQNGLALNPTTFTVSASRSWHSTFTATPWQRTSTSPNPAIENGPFPAGDIMNILTNNGTADVVTSITSATPVASTPMTIATAPTGGVSKSFTLGGNITPGFNHNLSGTYLSSVTVIAALD